MKEPVAGVVRAKTPRSVVPTPHTQTNSLLPILIPASIAAAAIVGKLFRRKKTRENNFVIEIRVEAVALILRGSEK